MLNHGNLPLAQAEWVQFTRQRCTQVLGISKDLVKSHGRCRTTQYSEKKQTMNERSPLSPAYRPYNQILHFNSRFFSRRE